MHHCSKYKSEQLTLTDVFLAVAAIPCDPIVELSNHSTFEYIGMARIIILPLAILHIN